MRDAYRLEELIGIVTGAFLVEDFVLAIGRLLREEELSESDWALIQEAHDLLEEVRAPSRDIVIPATVRQMDATEAFRSAVVQVAGRGHTLDGQAIDHLAAILAALERTLETRGLVADDVDVLNSARRIFYLVGEASLASATEEMTSQRRERANPWSPETSKTSPS